MLIRFAKEKDINRILDLLSEVLEIHHKIRPEFFNPGVTKYTYEDILELFSNKDKPIYVVVDDNDEVLAYAFCQIRHSEHPQLVKIHKTFYLDDLCVDQNVRHQGIGEELFKYVVREAKRLGCQDITLNSWEGNIEAERFYKKMGLKVRSSTFELIF